MDASDISAEDLHRLMDKLRDVSPPDRTWTMDAESLSELIVEVASLRAKVSELEGDLKQFNLFGADDGHWLVQQGHARLVCAGLREDDRRNFLRGVEYEKTRGALEVEVKKFRDAFGRHGTGWRKAERVRVLVTDIDQYGVSGTHVEEGPLLGLTPAVLCPACRKVEARKPSNLLEGMKVEINFKSGGPGKPLSRSCPVEAGRDYLKGGDRGC